MEYMKKVNEFDEIWVWAEQRNGKLMGVSLELLSKGKELAEKLNQNLAVVLIGDRVETMAEELIAYGAEKVYLIEDSRLELYQSDIYTNVMEKLIKSNNPGILLFGGTTIGMDFAPRIAARIQTGLTAHCIDLTVEGTDDDPELIGVLPGWGGNMMVKIGWRKIYPQMATVKPGVMEKPDKVDGRSGEIIKVKPDIKDEDFKARTIEVVEEKVEGIPLEDADIVVAAGWGMNSAGGFKIVEELAEVLSAVTAGTRPAVDAGWITEDKMIGSSGKTIGPKLFISLGASGAMHFTTGFSKAKAVLAIDKNPKAPIFDVCDIGIVCDAAEIIPFLIEEFK